VADPITVKPIFDTVAEFVHRGTLDQLVIYFSGHGFIRDQSEMWMLSGAPDNPNEAVSLRECIDLARETAIPSVVLISDACRSAADSLRAQRVRGSLIFPNAPTGGRLRPDVDRFFAALPGDPALELPVDNSSKTFEGIYTSSFLDAFNHPQTTMVRTVDGVDVVPNRSLKSYLVDDVSRRATAKSVRLQQLPDAILECGETTYIGRAVKSDTTAAPPPPPPPPPQARATVGDLADTELRRAGLSFFSAPNQQLPAQELARVSADTGFGTARQNIMDATGPVSFETQTGFSVNGGRVTRAVSSSGMVAQLLDQGDGDRKPAVIRLQPQGRETASVLLTFPDGSGTVVAAFRGYIGTLTVEKGRVMSVNYTPSRNHPRWDPGDYDRVAALRATVASAARFGAFRIEGSGDDRARRAAQIADRIRVFKSIDPSLGLYAAYAYAEAGVRDQVQSVHTIMRSDLNGDVFDVAMLAGALSGRNLADVKPVPVCPMLSQGWGWLRVRNVVVPPYLEKARDYLRPALWTTFEPGGIPIVESELQKSA
jgi:hypothetical protein